MRKIIVSSIALWASIAVVAKGATVSGRVDAGGAGLPSAVVAAYTTTGTLQSTATTDSAGRYALTVPVGTYRLLAYDNAGTYATTFLGDADSFESTTPMQITGDVSNINFVLRRAGRITGTVAPAIGRRDGITVAAYNLNGTRRGFTLTDANGAYTLVVPPGSYKVVAYDDAGTLWPKFYAEQQSFETASVVTIVADQNIPVAFHLEAAGHLTGTVTDAATNQPLAGISVLAYDASGTNLSAAVTNVTGAFDVRVPAGSFRLVAADPNRTYATAYLGSSTFTGATAIDIAFGQTRSGLVIAMRRGGTISGRITDASGSGIAATVAAYDSVGVLVSRTSADASGNYTLVLAPGGYRIAAFDDALTYATSFYPSPSLFRQATAVQVNAGSTSSGVNITLSRAARFTGNVTDQNGALLPGITIAAYDLNGELAGSATSNSAGGYTLAVGPGAYRVVAFDTALRYASAFAGGSSYETSTAFVESASASERVDFRLTRGVVVNGTVNDSTGHAITGVEVSALDANGNHVGTATTTASGFSLVLLPGTYRFTAVDPFSRYATTSTASVLIPSSSPAPSVALLMSSRTRRRAVPH